MKNHIGETGVAIEAERRESRPDRRLFGFDRRIEDMDRRLSELDRRGMGPIGAYAGPDRRAADRRAGPDRRAASRDRRSGPADRRGKD